MWVLATLRSDFFAQCESNSTLIALKGHSFGTGGMRGIGSWRTEISCACACAWPRRRRAGGRRGKTEDFLLGRGKPLAESEDLLTRRRADLATEDIAFVEALRSARRRQEIADTRRRRRVLTAISFWQYGKAETAARRASHARNEAEKLIDFMGVDMRDKLKPIGRLELLDSANQRARVL